MSKKSLGKRSSHVAEGGAIDVSNSDEQRLDLEKIVDINPWKDMNKYDEQEAGQIQQVLTEFNDMVITDNKKNKGKSSMKNRRSVSPAISTANDEAIVDKSAINTSESIVASENTSAESDRRTAGDEIIRGNGKSMVQREKNEKSSLPKKPEERKSIGKERSSSSSTNKIVDEQSIDKATTKKEKFKHWLAISDASTSNVIVEKNIYANEIRDDEIVDKCLGEEKMVEDNIAKNFDEVIESLGDVKMVEDDITKKPEKTIESLREVKNVGENGDEKKIIVGDDSSLPSSANKLENIELVELSSDDDDCSTNDRKPDVRSMRRGFDNLGVNSSKKIVEEPKIKSEILKNIVSSAIGTRSESNNNHRHVKTTKKSDVKIAKAFGKFSKKFVKYSDRMTQAKTRASATIDSSIDSESDSSSSDSRSGGSSSYSTSSSCPCSDSTSCSCCGSSSSSLNSSSSSSYTSCSDSTSSGACSCPCCCVDDEYSEFTLASSSSTYSGSEGSNESSTE